MCLPYTLLNRQAPYGHLGEVSPILNRIRAGRDLKPYLLQIRVYCSKKDE